MVDNLISSIVCVHEANSNECMDAPPWRFTLPANPQPEIFIMDQHIHSSNLGPMEKASRLPEKVL